MGCVGADDGAGELDEDGGDFRDLHLGFDGVVLVVEADAEDARRARDGREESDVGERDARSDGDMCAGGCEGVWAGFNEREDRGVAEGGEVDDLGFDR